ncbi:hypothetical protein KBX37_06010 [Micromonospora sp. U56]|uniref:FIMAH domain-containing protein n=1 Tax=Micromonospora sp. U56 TaxID=2824900 RepID=UPI001B38ACE8|nr:hypothetical protein [Micromonospora sp. U56]MBQ0892663.1 hypothetical protein [Micromonospora sp. U56]
MSAPGDLNSPGLARPTSLLPLVRPAGSRHRAPDDGRRLMWLAVGVAALVLVAALLAVVFAGGEEDGGPVAGPTVAIGTSAPVEATEPVTDEISPTPAGSPSPSSSAPRRSATPAELAAGLRATVDELVQERQLRSGGGNELRKRLREVEERIADGEPDKAREKLREFAEKLVSLRREDKLTARGYEVLVAGATQLAQALPAR